MKYKTLKGLCKYIAKCNQQDKAQKLYNRTIWKSTDFTEQDNKEIDITANLLEMTINEYKTIIKTYTDFKQLIRQLQDITQHYFYGTLVQNEILATSGIILKD